MRNRSLVCLIVSLILGLSVLLGACAPAGAPGPGGEQPIKMLTISGGSIGGMTNLDAALWAGVAKKYANLDSTVLTNETMLQAKIAFEGLADISTSVSVSNWDVYTNTGEYALGTPGTKLRALFYDSSYPMLIHVPVKSTIQSFSDLVGKKIAVRYRASFAGYVLLTMIRALGYDPDKDFKVQEMAYEEGATAMTLGILDAYAATALPPHATFGQTDLTDPLKLLTLTDAEVQKILSVNSAFTRYEIPAKYYHMDKPIVTLDAPGVGTSTTDLPEDIVYKIVKGRAEDTELAGYYHVTLKEFIEEGRPRQFVEAGGGIPFHVGAIRYFKEVGWNVPASIIPPEYKP